MSTFKDLDLDNEDWFKRHVINKLDELAEGQIRIARTNSQMHEQHRVAIDELKTANSRHAAEDALAFASIDKELVSLKLVKQIFFAFIAMMLATVAGGIIAEVFKSSKVVVP